MEGLEEGKKDWQKIPKQKWARTRFPGPLEYDAQSFLNVLQHDSIKRCVQDVQVYTCETRCVGHLLESKTVFDQNSRITTLHGH
jgi:hypothetical protein